MFYKIVHHIVAEPSDILIPTDNRIHPQTYRHILTFKDCNKYSFLPLTITQWNVLPPQVVLSPTLNICGEQLTPTVVYNIEQ